MKINEAEIIVGLSTFWVEKRIKKLVDRFVWSTFKIKVDYRELKIGNNITRKKLPSDLEIINNLWFSIFLSVIVNVMLLRYDD